MKTKKVCKRVTGQRAIERAAKHGTTLHKYADPTEGARKVSLSEARSIAREDASLIYATVCTRRRAKR